MNPEVIKWTVFQKHMILSSSEGYPLGILEGEDRVSSNSWKCQSVQSPKYCSGKWNCFLCSHLDSATDSCLGEHGRVWWHNLCGAPAPIWTQVCHVALLLPGNDSKCLVFSWWDINEQKICPLCRIIKACT